MVERLQSMNSTLETSEGDIPPVVAPTLAPNEASAPTPAAAPTAASPNADAASKLDECMALFGPQLLLPGEDPDSWKKLHADVSAAVAPADVFEQIPATSLTTSGTSSGYADFGPDSSSCERAETAGQQHTRR
jgi:hypothetical protein